MNDTDDIRRLRETLEKYRMMTKHAGYAIICVDPETGDIIGANLKAVEMTGFSDGELTGMKVWDLHPDDQRATAKTKFEQVVEERAGEESEMQIQRKDGGCVTADVSTTVIQYGGRRMIERICKDVSETASLREDLLRAKENLERKVDENRRELRDKQAQLVHLEKMAELGSLVAGVAHEINTPLGALHSNIDTLVRTFAKIRAKLCGPDVHEDVREDPDLVRLLDAVDDLNSVNHTASKRIVAIVDTLRKFARMEESERKNTDLHEGIESTLTLVHHQLKNRINVIKNYGDIPPVKCYPDNLNQVFLNLLVNAAQAIEGKGTITITTGLRDSGDAVFVEVSDDGPGIEPENLSRIFDPGFTTKGAGEGTGLGLSIVNQIIKDHSGRVEVESDAGKGTTFRVVLPLKR
jgi:two-component system NtrC family sensor kinase